MKGDCKLCECSECEKDIHKDWPYYVDRDGNPFCSVECAIEFHGIKETEFEEDADWYE